MSESPQAGPQLVQRITAAANALSPQEAAQRYQQIMAQLPPEVAARVSALAFSQVPPDERRQVAAQLRQANDDPRRPFDGFTYADEEEGAQPMALGRMTKRARDQDPALLGSLLGGDSSLGGQLGRMALTALAYVLIQRVMGDQAGGRAIPSAGAPTGAPNPLGDLLGGLLGGQGTPPGRPAGADPIGSILDGLLGGGHMPPSEADRMGRSIAEALGGGTAGAPQGRAAPHGAPDLDDLLDGLLGGGARQQGDAAGSQPQMRADDEPGAGLHVRGSRKKS
ncbi:MAG TPA: hypothetical protein VNL77_04445 [Roseiflexaceae bacterium]|nr:hypothetical protein [Roseiflexaceae bacterium]